ncbi:hypothetical protein FZC66_09425 [Priestia megaterium]|nr:hypothetical protein FZC66_09425 [Priestia megaterium]
MKKILLFTLVALLATFFIDRAYSERNQAQLQKQLINEIENMKEKETNEYVVVDFNKLFDFKWDQVYVFGPESTVKDVNEKLGFKWMEAKSKGIEQDNNMNFIVFVENHQVTQYVKIPTTYGDIIPKTAVANQS